MVDDETTDRRVLVGGVGAVGNLFVVYGASVHHRYSGPGR